MGEIWNLIESVSEGFPTYSHIKTNQSIQLPVDISSRRVK